jgi:hypothetical protein
VEDFLEQFLGVLLNRDVHLQLEGERPTIGIPGIGVVL